MTVDKSVLLALADRCETACEPSRVLDEDIAAALIGATPELQADGRRAWHKDGFWVSIEPVRLVSSSLDAALLLVPKGLCWRYDSALDYAEIFDIAKSPIHVAGSRDDPTLNGHATPALALVSAALRARARI